MSDLYPLLVTNSFLANFIFTMDAEEVFFAMLSFGGFSVPMITLLALLASMVAMLANWLVGRALADVAELAKLGDESGAFQIFCAKANRYGKWVLLLNWVVPFGCPLAVAAGIVRIPLPTFLLLIWIGRLGYYLFAAFTYQAL